MKSEDTGGVVFVRTDVRCSQSRTVFNRCIIRVFLLLSGTLSETLEPRFCVVADLRIHDVASFQYHREVVFVLAAQVGIGPQPQQCCASLVLCSASGSVEEEKT